MIAALSVVDAYRSVLVLVPVVIVLLLRNGGVLAIGAWFALAVPTILYSGVLILWIVGIVTVPFTISVVSNGSLGPSDAVKPMRVITGDLRTRVVRGVVMTENNEDIEFDCLGSHWSNARVWRWQLHVAEPPSQQAVDEFVDRVVAEACWP